MFVFCPGCSTIYAVQAAHLQTAGGQVRCRECQLVYNAVDYLFEDLSAVQAALNKSAPASDAAGTGAIQTTHATDTDVPAGAETDDAGREDRDGQGDPVEAVPLIQPVTRSGWQTRGLSWKDVVSGAGIGLLLMSLGVQWVFFNRAGLAGDPGWRPTLERFCNVVHCDLPLRVDLSKIEIINRDVRQHPIAEQALLINAAFRNNAGFTQPFPVFEISFTDPSGSPIAMRRFGPDEYLAEDADLGEGMLSDVPIHVVLEVLDPGDRAVSFQIGFL